VTFRHAPQVAWRRVGEEVVLLDLGRRQYFSLNATGAEVWELLGRGLSEDAVTAELSDRYGRPARLIKRDVASLARSLRREGLLTATSE
jgi:hypothetical protein